jgi:hypothetical protein
MTPLSSSAVRPLRSSPRRSRLARAGSAVAAVAAVVAGASSCAALKEARLGFEETVQPRVVERITSLGSGPIEVRCGLGELCSEIKIIHVERSKDGPVDVTLVNRTEEPVAVQLALEGFDARQHRTDRTGYHDVILAPRDEGVLELVTSASIDDTLVVHLRPRTS